MSEFAIILEHTANPDIKGYWTPPKDPCYQAVPVNSLEGASQAFRGWIRYNGLGGGNLTEHAGKVIRVQDGQIVARVSYNGRIWDTEGKEIAA